MKDPWNPSELDIRAWAFSNESWPTQDWEIAVNNEKHDELIISLACDKECPTQDFFLHSIYFMVGDAIYSEKTKERKENLRELITRTPDASKEITKWKKESLELLDSPEKFEYGYWCNHLYRNGCEP